MDYVEYIGWRAFFKADKPGGVRTQTQELNDFYAARSYAAFFNVNRKEDMAAAEIRDFLEFPPEITPEISEAQHEAAVIALGNKVDMIFTRHNARVNG
jgi:hypothetical protein